MKTLLHICCGPCALYPLRVLEESGHSVTGYFYNPNIHPYKEFRRRLNSLTEFAEKSGLVLHTDKEYGLTSFLQKIVFNERQRCQICYKIRLRKTVKFAKGNGFDSFTTTLLYSRYQKHEQIEEICKNLSREFELDFIYRDFRIGWQEGIDESISLELYRQPYCGCIYSEQERYDKKFKKTSNPT